MSRLRKSLKSRKKLLFQHLKSSWPLDLIRRNPKVRFDVIHCILILFLNLILVLAPKQLKEEPNESKETTKVEEKKKVSSSPKKNELPKIDLYDKIVSDDLANILVEESEMITRKYKLATIPAKKTVYDAIHAVSIIVMFLFV